MKKYLKGRIDKHAIKQRIYLFILKNEWATKDEQIFRKKENTPQKRENSRKQRLEKILIQKVKSGLFFQ